MASFDTILKTSYDLDTTEVFKLLDKYELTDAQKSVLAVSIIQDKIGGSRRRFNYSKPLASTDDDCEPEFARTFIHADWQDGEDVVSAEGSNGDEGFNARFHKIEADLDALSRDTSGLFECMMELRGQLSLLLEEVRAELNRINADIHDLSPKSGDVTLPPIRFPGEVFQPKKPLEVLPFPIDVGPLDPRVRDPRVIYPGIASELIASDKVWTPRDDATVGLIGGMKATRISEGVFNGGKVELWQTPIGTVLTPVAAAAAPKAGYLDPRMEVAGRIGAWSVENADKVKDKFGGQAFTKADLEREFGTEDIGGGVMLRDALRNVDASASFANTDEMADKVVTTRVEEIRAAGADTIAGIGAVGLHAGEAGPGAAAIDAFAAATPEERQALAGAGIKTVADLAAADPAKVAGALTVGNVSADAAKVSAGRLRGIATAVGRLRGG